MEARINNRGGIVLEAETGYDKYTLREFWKLVDGRGPVMIDVYDYPEGVEMVVNCRRPRKEETHVGD